MLDVRDRSDPEPSATPRRASLWLLGIPAIALLVALVLRWSTPTFGRLVSYELELLNPAGQVGGLAHVGAGAPAHVDLAPGQGLALVLQPHTPHTDPVEASVFFAARGAPRGAEPAPLAVPTEALAGGALKLSLSAGALPEPGRMIVFVGRPGAPPRSPVGAAAHGRDWQRFDVDVVRQ